MQEYSVSEFHAEMNTLFRDIHVAVVGEVSGFNISHNKFVWFTVKDDKSALSCFMMKWELKVPLEDGMEVRLVGSPNIQSKAGRYVFRPRTVELVGEGALQRAFELTKAQLEEEGLFDEARKRPLPRFPKRVGIITSQDAAAYTDFVRIFNGRWGGVELLHFPVNVQGASAIPSILDAFRLIDAQYKDLDVVVLTRGGGSLEDLQAFNSEEVARAVFGCNVPVVCGVGHERDVSLADYVADVRAATPTHAAELVVPDREEILAEVTGYIASQTHNIDRALLIQNQAVDRQLFQLDHHMRDHMVYVKERIALFFSSAQSFVHDMRSKSNDIDNLQILFSSHIAQALKLAKQQLTQHDRLLASLNPKAVLARGYSVTTNEKGKIIRDPKEVKSGDALKTEVQKGIIHSKAI